jgi:hypothetical protein
MGYPMETETRVYTRYSILTEDINRAGIAKLCREHKIDCTLYDGVGLFNGNIEASLTIVHLAPLETNAKEEIKALARDIKAENNQREIWITEETVTLKKLLDNAPAIG